MIVIIGESGSGKSALAKALVEKHPELKRIVTYTTRPMREGEENGKDYYFVSSDAFKELAKRNFFAEISSYRGWMYGTALSDCSDKHNVLAVLTPSGVRLLKKVGVDVKVIYLEVDRRSRLIGLLNRGDDVEEAYRRNLSDVGQFDGVENEADYVIRNPAYRMSIDDAVKCVEEMLAEIEGETQSDGN